MNIMIKNKIQMRPDLIQFIKHYTLGKVLLSLIALTPATSLSADNSLIQSITKDIQSSQNALAKSEKRISTAQSRLSNKIHTVQAEVEALRKKTAAARRLMDEQTLGLDRLKSRVKQWRDQNLYQQHILASYAEGAGHNAAEISAITHDISAGITLVNTSFEQLNDRLYPSWKKSEAIIADGEIQEIEKLTLGPVTWYLDSNQQTTGLLELQTQQPSQAIYHFSQNAGKGLNQLYQDKNGYITFDPSLDRALQIENHSESILQHISKGGIWALPILFFALISLSIAAYKAYQLFKLPKLMPLLAERIEMIGGKSANTIQELKALLAKLDGAQAQLLKIALKTPSSQQRDDKLFALLLEHKHSLEKLLGVIAITAAVAPLLGLLGTVSGMIETFKMMNLFGAGDPAAVSGGISEALVTTELGLVVAIPSLVLHALLSRRIKNYNHELETTAIKLSKIKITA